MDSREQLKGMACAEIDRRREEIYAIGETILRNPELGFKEEETAALVASEFDLLGLSHRRGLALTGVKARVSTGRPGPTVAVMGELDAVVVPQHPFANPATGAAHACGHNGQIAAMLGAARALLGTGVLDSLSGDLVFFAVPAEELVEIEYRLGLRESGKLEFLSGKQELVRLGEFDDVDMAMIVHSHTFPGGQLAGAPSGWNGCVAKRIQFLGQAAHAGSSPHEGVNALNAATIALHAIHAQRETFRDEDAVRVHPIITRGGDLVNVVPSDVRMETFVRGKSLEAIDDANAKVDRCLRAGALATGATAVITTTPGYAPLANHARLLDLYRANAVAVVGGEEMWVDWGHAAGSTDMGDLSLIMPVLHPYHGGVSGSGHGADYCITDREVFYLSPAKSMAMTVIDLLWDGASEANSILAASRPRFTKEEYLAFLRRYARVEEYRG